MVPFTFGNVQDNANFCPREYFDCFLDNSDRHVTKDYYNVIFAWWEIHLFVVSEDCVPYYESWRLHQDPRHLP